MVQLVPKIRGACYPRQYRPIALLPILYRLYSRILLHMTRDKLDQLAAPQFAFRKNHQAGECIFLLIQLIEQHVEWDMPLCICDGDIYKAYDETNHMRVCNALIGKQVHLSGQ